MEKNDPIFEICGSSRHAPIVREDVPGSVASRYRSIKFVSAASLIAQYNTNWFIEFKKHPTTDTPEGIVLTVTNGSAMPKQPSVSVRGAASCRGTLIVSEATADILTGTYAAQFLQSTPDAFDIFVTIHGFEYHRLIPAMANLKLRKPNLFLRKPPGLSKRMKKVVDPKQ
tara:strand:- start:1106 stop:1615 length:510 start_codon:yes stop_codon:yes gene_type:complete